MFFRFDRPKAKNSLPSIPEKLKHRMYHLLGKNVRIHLYNHDGVVVGTVTGRVADVAEAVEVAPGMKKDLALVVDIDTGDPEHPYTNSAGTEGESWFAIQDLEVVDTETPRLFSN